MDERSRQQGGRRRAPARPRLGGPAGLAAVLAVALVVLALPAGSVRAGDPVPPETAIGPIAPSIPVWFTFEVRGIRIDAPVDHVECRLDDAPWEPCATPWAPVLVAGPHTIEARAVDVNGLADPTPEYAAFTVVTVGPAATIVVNEGAAATGRLLVHLDIDGPDIWGGTRLHLSATDTVDEGGWLTTAWVGTLQSLVNAQLGWHLDLAEAGGDASPGDHRVCVQAEDVYGDPGPVACDAITYDPGIATGVRIRLAASENPAPLGDRVIVRAIAEASDGAPIADGTLDLRVADGGGDLHGSMSGPFADVGTWVDASGLAAGSYPVEARFGGSADLDDAAVAMTLRIASTPGLTPPQAGLRLEGTLPAPDDPQPFTLTPYARNNLVSRIECRIDESPWSTCKDPIQVPVLDPGMHTAEARGIGANGAVQPVPDLVAWRVTAPEAGQWWAGGGAATRATTLSLSFDMPTAQAIRISSDRSRDGDGRLVKALELRPAPAMGTPVEWSLVDPAYGGTDQDGIKLVWVQAQLGNGSWSPPELATVLLDRTRPTVAIRIEDGSPFVDEGSLFVLGKTDETSRVYVTDDPAAASNHDGLGTGAEGGLAFIAWPVDPAPGETATKTLYAVARDNAGNWSDVVSASIIIDRSPPVADLRPVGFVVGSRVSSTRARAWIRSTAADTGSGVSRLTLQELTTTTASTIATAKAGVVKVKRDLRFAASRRYRARAVDRLAHTSVWVTGPSTRPVLRDSRSSRLSWSGAWRTVGTPSALGGSYRRTSASGASVSLPFTGRAIAVVAPTGRSLGKVDILVDGVKVAVVDLRAATTKSRVIVFARSWTSSAAHLVTVRCRATSGRPAVGVDGFVVLP